MRAAGTAALAAVAGLVAGCGGEERPPAADPARTTDMLARVFPGSLTRARPVAPGLRPAFRDRGPTLALTGSLARGRVSERDGAFVLDTPGGPLRASLEDGVALSARLLAGRQAALLTGAAPDTDVVVRAAPAGYTTYVVVRRPADEAAFAWRIEPPEGGRVEALAKGNAGVILAGGDAGAPAPGGGRVVATVSAALALDARGRRLKASLSAQGGSLRLRLGTSDGAPFPVAARLEWIPSGELGGGWFAYGVPRALRRSTYRMSGKRIEGLCAEEEQGSLGPGEVEVSRQVASRARSCRSLVETGTP